MFITTPLENVRGVVKGTNYFMNCYIFVLVWFPRRLRDPSNCVVMDSKKKFFTNQYFTKQPPKEAVRAVAPWTRTWERSG